MFFRETADSVVIGKMRLIHSSAISIVAMIFASAGAPAFAAEHVYLRSGADLVCDHREPIANQVRLYLTPSADNYLDVAADDIVRTETVPQPLPAAVQAPSTASQLRAPLNLPALLNTAGVQHHIDPDLLASVVRAESGGRPSAVSRAGARGLMQLMPRTAADLGVRDSFAPAQNVAGGVTYLDALLMYYHDDVALALAAYNAGPAAVDHYHGIPPYAETRRYVQRIIHDYNRRKLLEARRSSNSKSQLAALEAEKPGHADKLATR
jgi:soluble lytic murein transglycosylase-like protein